MFVGALIETPPPNGKDELAISALKVSTNDNRTPTCTPAMSHTPTPALGLPLVLANSTAKYSEKDLQRILKTVLEARVPAPALHLLVFPNRPYERPLKARFPDLYHSKTHIECYNFCQ